jgi:F-type H+-transporting ATPase subunit delta
VRQETIALNYAEALFALADKAGQHQLFADLMDALASAVEQAPGVQAVLMSPRVTKAEKARILSGALAEAPRDMILFLQAIVKRSRQGLLRQIADAFLGLVDVKFNRVRADVTLAREPNEDMRRSIQTALEEMLDKEVIAEYHTEPAILGGTIVRVGDRVFDGSIRRRATVLRRKLLAQ